jgi:predicted RNA-binding protein associated with RNAse of E/G family
VTVREVKRKLDGRVARFDCEALEVGAERAIVRYRPERDVVLGGLRLPAGTVSYGIFWRDRPYNVYLWVGPDGATLAAYCNVAAETRISAEAVDWLDLEADVLITPDGRAQVLDLEEVPGELAPPHRAALDAALARLRAGAAVLAEAERCVDPYRG